MSARTASRFGHPGIEDTAAVTFAFDDGSVAQLTSVWHQVLTRESGRHLEVFCEGAALWTDDDYLGPLHVQTSDGTQEIMGELPEWAGLLTVPEVYAKSIAHYGAAGEGVPRRRSPPGRAGSGAAAAVPSGYPGAAEALAAHRLVDQAYRSAAAGGAPVATDPASPIDREVRLPGVRALLASRVCARMTCAARHRPEAGPRSLH